MRARNAYEQALMKKSGFIASCALKAALEAIKVGATEIEVDKIAEKEIYKQGGDLSYKTVPGYKYATCITVNDEVVHGIPTERKFEEGDLVSVDLAVVYKGWHTDCAWSVLVSKQGTRQRPASTSRRRGERGSPEAEGDSGQSEKVKFLEVGEAALWDGIAQAVDGARVGDISSAIQKKVEGAGFAVVRSLVGHGVGKSLHEDPEIPGFGKKGTGPIIKSGVSLAIEVIYTGGASDVVLGDDGWTFRSTDGSLGGLFEMSVIVGRNQAEVLTDWRTV